ncbi:MAG: BamA/TamA family outer membrane protein [Bacteroidetes bacterium]|nr:BamA/TamA family outer membrane protein [Bacteroidota bacterium]MCH8941459.1 BamA/TamA family outer membrane protein [Bacteroidota bacterium]
MNKYALFYIYLLICSPFIFSQNTDTTFFKWDYSFIVDSINVSGNDLTEKEIIFKEITFSMGDVITPKILTFNRERIFSLRIFTKVELISYRFQEKNFINIKVEESWYIYPVPFAHIQDRDWDKLSYGLALLVFNFRGRNEKLKFVGALGYNPRLDFSYSVPYLNYKSEISFEGGIKLQKVKNKSHIAKKLWGGDFDQTVRSGRLFFGKRFGTYTRVGITTAYATIETPKFIKGISASDTRIDHLFTLAFNYSYDTRDLSQFPREGMYASSILQLKGLGIDGISYQVLNFDLRKYFKLNDDLSLKWRFASRFTFGDLIPFYDNSFLGFNERIRGHFRQELEGNNSYIGSAEINYALFNDMNLNLDFIPFIPKRLLRYRVALYLQLFADTGTIQNKNEPLSIKKLNSGYGIGLTLLLLPYNVFRLERAWDEYGNPEWIFDVRVSF